MTEQQRQHDEAVITAENLTTALEGVHQELRTVNEYGHRNRRLIRWLGISLALGLLLLGMLIYVQFQLYHSRATIAQIHSAQISACETGNELRLKQQQIWKHVIDVSLANPPPHQTHAQKEASVETAADFLAYVRQVLPRENCPKIYRIGS